MSENVALYSYTVEMLLQTKQILCTDGIRNNYSQGALWLNDNINNENNTNNDIR